MKYIPLVSLTNSINKAINPSKSTFSYRSLIQRELKPKKNCMNAAPVSGQLFGNK